MLPPLKKKKRGQVRRADGSQLEARTGRVHVKSEIFMGHPGGPQELLLSSGRVSEVHKASSCTKVEKQ